jgi:IclR family pca regulon transcriptional regulator
MSEKIKRTEKVNSLVRGLQVLKAFGKYHEPMTITEVAAEVGLAPASARRMLLTLAEQGYVEQNGKRFRVGPKVLDLGYSYMSSMPIWQIAQPVLEELSDTFHVSAAAAVLDGCDALYVIRSNSHQPSSILVSTGTRLPAHVTAMGRVLLANLAAERIDDLLPRVKFNQLTEKSVTSAAQLRKLLAQVRQQGYSIVDEEMIFGLRAIAVPLRNKRGDIVASINACGNRRSLEIAYLKDTVLPALAQASEKIRLMLPA